MAWSDTTMPSTPTFKFDPGNTNPATPMAKLSDFWAANKWDNPYDKYTSDVGGYGKGFLDQAKGANPFGAGGFLGDPSSFMSKFNMNYPDINNPGTVSSLGKWGDYLGSGTQTAIESMLPKIASAGIAGQRGGFGVAGGTDPASGLQKQAIQTAAGGFTQNIQDAMKYMQNLAAYNQQGAGQYLDAYGKMYGSMLGAGTGLMGQQLQGLEAGDRSKANWLNSAYGAYSGDVNSYNTNVQQAPDIAWQRKQRNQGWADQQSARDMAEWGRQGQVQAGAVPNPGFPAWYQDTNMGPIWRQAQGEPFYPQGGGGGFGGNSSLLKKKSSKIPLNSGGETWRGGNKGTQLTDEQSNLIWGEG